MNAGVLRRQAIVLLAGPLAESRSRRGSSPGWMRLRGPAELRAIHEAGHAIVAIRLGFHVYSASVTPCPSQAVGYGCYSGGRILFGLTLHTSAIPARESVGAGLHDYQHAARLCYLLSGEADWRPVLRVARLLRVEASAIVDENWPAVISLSEVLALRGDLGQEEVDILSGKVAHAA